MTATAWGRLYVLSALILLPFNILASLVLRGRQRPRSVVHIGELRHLQFNFVAELRRRGIDATYVAVGGDGHWSRCDLHLPHLANPLAAAIRDSLILWRVVARHAVVHCHCLMGVTHYQWEFFLLKLSGCRLVGHVRGCEGRDGQHNMAMHPLLNICRECDYRPRPLCEAGENRRRRWVAAHVMDAVLVTTPDLKDFWPQAVHLPFFLPPQQPEIPRKQATGGPLVVAHVTNQPGIEATERIHAIVDALAAKGHNIVFDWISGRSHAEVLAALAEADVTVGKMTMGYYANAQIEGAILGVPAITWVRDDLMTPDLAESGLILTSLDRLGETLEALMQDRQWLEILQKEARGRISALHDSERIVSLLLRVYGWDAC